MINTLHAHIETDGIFTRILTEVVLDGLIDTLKIAPFLFLTYLLMEFIEHKASDKTRLLLEKSGSLGPLAGAGFGILPQCAFSAVAANLYTGRIITVGTVVAAFLSTSDEMLPLMISEGLALSTIAIILGYKLGAAILVGFAVDIAMRLLGKNKKEINIDEICDNDNCHCERGILLSALHHTLTISAFILITSMLLNALIFFIGADALGSALSAIPILSYLIAAIIGLIPGCATSVAITTLGLSGIITAGTMMAGLFSSAGVGMLILLRLNKNKKEILSIAAILVISAFLFGMLFDLIGIGALIA